ncbi:hypothetical protein Bca52824_095288 [Brassica carinata]|uniref:Uncharacterized protein n=1 Tax=Brassica carinata TaxID=52824 RepID=A0A8X7TIC2_BRACI|nr:hypothetical protein Bca52824_095288 [Brassica carinata]
MRERIRPHQHDTRFFRLDLTTTISRRRRSSTTANLELRNTEEPPSRPTLLFHALSSLRRASSIQSRAHPTEQSIWNHEPSNTLKAPTGSKTDPTN